MGRRRCCCGCVQFLDEFERPDADTLGPQWELVENDAEWEIEDWKAKASKGTALWVGQLPDKHGSAILDVELVDMQEGDVFEILWAWKDESNYMFVRFEVRDGPSEWSLEHTMKTTIGKVVAGEESSVSDHDVLHAGCVELMAINNHSPLSYGASSRQLRMYFDRNTLQLDSGAAGGDLWNCVSEADGRRVGMRRPDGNTRPLFFNSFFASEHYVTNPTCPDRGCRCGATFCLPDELLAVMEHYSGDDANQIDDPVEFALHRRAKRDAYQWWSPRVIPGYDYMEAGPTCFGFRLHCTAEEDPEVLPINQYVLDWENDYPCTEPDCFEDPFLPLSQTGQLIFAQCDPLLLIYELDMTADTGKVPVHYDEIGVGSYTGPGGKYRLTITEPE